MTDDRRSGTKNPYGLVLWKPAASHPISIIPPALSAAFLYFSMRFTAFNVLNHQGGWVGGLSECCEVTFAWKCETIKEDFGSFVWMRLCWHFTAKLELYSFKINDAQQKLEVVFSTFFLYNYVEKIHTLYTRKQT